MKLNRIAAAAFEAFHQPQPARGEQMNQDEANATIAFQANQVRLLVLQGQQLQASAQQAQAANEKAMKALQEKIDELTKERTELRAVACPPPAAPEAPPDGAAMAGEPAPMHA